MQLPHRRSQVKQRSRLARAVFQGRRDVGGLPGQGPPRRGPDRNGSHLGRGEGASGEPRPREEPLLRAWGRWGSAHLHPYSPPPITSNPPQRPVALCLPVPWMTVCSGKPGSGSRPLAQEVVSPSRGGSCLHRFPPRAARWHQRCHGSNVICKCSFLDFQFFCEDLRPTCSGRLCVSGAQSLYKVGGVWQFFFLMASVCKIIGPSHVSWGREGRDEKGKAGRQAGAHTLLQPSSGAGVLPSGN